MMRERPTKNRYIFESKIVLVLTRGNFSKIVLKSAQNRGLFEISEQACVKPLYTR